MVIICRGHIPEPCNSFLLRSEICNYKLKSILLYPIIMLALLLKTYILCQSYARGSGENFLFLRVFTGHGSQRSSFARPG